MDIQVRTGEGLECEYTGHDAIALVRIKRDWEGEGGTLAGDAGGQWTLWMGRSALEQALRMLGTAENSQAIPFPPPAVVAMASAQAHALSSRLEPASTGAPRPPSGPPGWTKPTNPPALMQQFERQLTRLIDRGQTEEDEKGKLRGLVESDLRELVASFVDALPNRTQMFGVLRRKIGMEKSRFDLLVSSIEAAAVVERARGEDGVDE